MSATGLVLTFGGLRELIHDLLLAGKQPAAIIVSEFEKKDLKFELMAFAKETSDDAEERVDDCIGFVEGIPILSSPEVERGKAHIMVRNNEMGRPDLIKVH